MNWAAPAYTITAISGDSHQGKPDPTSTSPNANPMLE